MPVTVSVLPWWESSYMKFIQGWMCCIWESEWEFRKDKTMRIPVPVCHVDEKADEVYSWTTRRVLFRQWQSACCPTVQPKTVIIVWLCNQATVITGINRWLTENKNKKQSPTVRQLYHEDGLPDRQVYMPWAVGQCFMLNLVDSNISILWSVWYVSGPHWFCCVVLHCNSIIGRFRQGC